MAEAENATCENSGCEAELLKLRLLVINLKGKQKAKTVQIALLVIVALAGLLAILLFRLNDDGVAMALSLSLLFAFLCYGEIDTLMSIKTLLEKTEFLLDAAESYTGCESANEQAVDKKAGTPNDFKRADAAMVRPASS